MLAPNPSATCRVCSKPFIRFQTMQTVCGGRCAARVGKLARKAERESTRQRKEKLKRPKDWLAEARVVAQKYARVRDRLDGCISCDKGPNWQGQWHGSHFRSVGAASGVCLNLWNIHKACSQCNKWQSGNIAAYEPRLRAKIGDDRVDWLKAQNGLARYSVDYIKRYKRVLSKRIRRMEKRNGLATD